jgi:trk system potassium uptake protein TrkA
MFIVIVGGGKVGYYLTKTLLSYNHSVIVVEPQIELCEKLATNLNIPVCNGDGTTIDKLSEANADKAAILIAVTGRDEDNLISCQLAKNNFGIRKTIARVNNPKNINVFKQLGVDSVVSSTAHIADIIEHEVDWASINQMLSLKMGNVRIKDISVAADSDAVNKKVADLSLPEGTILMSIIRGSTAVIPNGQTQISAQDSIIALTREENIQKLYAYFSGK